MKKAGRGPGLFLQGPGLIPGLWHVVRVAPQTVTSLATSAYSSIWSKFMYL